MNVHHANRDINLHHLKPAYSVLYLIVKLAQVRMYVRHVLVHPNSQIQWEVPV